MIMKNILNNISILIITLICVLNLALYDSLPTVMQLVVNSDITIYKEILFILVPAVCVLALWIASEKIFTLYSSGLNILFQIIMLSLNTYLLCYNVV